MYVLVEEIYLNCNLNVYLQDYVGLLDQYQLKVL